VCALLGFGAAIAIEDCEVRNTNFRRKKIMAKPTKKGKTLGAKKLEKKVTLTERFKR
jgi:hypothetical protein